MKHLLHILAGPPPAELQAIRVLQQQAPETAVREFDLTAEDPDYGKLVEEIFRADGIQVWSAHTPEPSSSP